MPLPLLKRNSDLVYRVEASLNRAREEAGISSENVHRIGGASIDAVAAAAANEARMSLGRLEAITGPEQRAVIEQTFKESSELYERINLAVPSLEDFSIGIDLVDIARKWKVEKIAGHEPELILAPNGLSTSQWLELFQNLQDDPVVNRDGTIRNGGLYIDSTENAWNKLNKVPKNVVTVNTTSSIQWTLRIIPSTAQLSTVSTAHDGTTLSADQKPVKVTEANHPTVAEYLSLQARRLQRHEAPIDSITRTWLHGTFEDTKGTSLTLFGFWGTGQVRLNKNSPSVRTGFLGVRPPVR